VRLRSGARRARRPSHRQVGDPLCRVLADAPGGRDPDSGPVEEQIDTRLSPARPREPVASPLDPKASRVSAQGEKHVKPLGILPCATYGSGTQQAHNAGGSQLLTPMPDRLEPRNSHAH